MRRVGVAELKDQLSRHLRAVEAGAEIEVTDRDRPIARIVPVRATATVPVIGPSRPFAEIRDKVYPPANWPVDSLQLLLEDRRKR